MRASSAEIGGGIHEERVLGQVDGGRGRDSRRGDRRHLMIYRVVRKIVLGILIFVGNCGK